MGEFHWPVGVWSADGERLETVDALVDTGSSYSVSPESAGASWALPGKSAMCSSWPTAASLSETWAMPA